MANRTSLPPAPSQPRSGVLQTSGGRVACSIERCGPSYLVVCAQLRPPLGSHVRVRIPSTSFGELSLDATVRWHEEEGRLGLQLGALRARELVALRRLVPEPAPDARLATRRRGYRVDARMDPFAPQPERTLPYDGIPVSLFLVNAEIEGVATTLERDRAVVYATVDLAVGSHVALRVYEDPAMTRWTDRAMVVVSSRDGLIELGPQRRRWGANTSSVF